MGLPILESLDHIIGRAQSLDDAVGTKEVRSKGSRLATKASVLRRVAKPDVCSNFIYGNGFEFRVDAVQVLSLGCECSADEVVRILKAHTKVSGVGFDRSLILIHRRDVARENCFPSMYEEERRISMVGVDSGVVGEGGWLKSVDSMSFIF
jgi:hypothetical protein